MNRPARVSPNIAWPPRVPPFDERGTGWKTAPETPMLQYVAHTAAQRRRDVLEKIAHYEGHIPLLMRIAAATPLLDGLNSKHSGNNARAKAGLALAAATAAKHLELLPQAPTPPGDPNATAVLPAMWRGSYLPEEAPTEFIPAVMEVMPVSVKPGGHLPRHLREGE